MAIEIVASSDVPRTYAQCKTAEQREEWTLYYAKSLTRKLWPEEFDTKPDLRVLQGGRKS